MSAKFEMSTLFKFVELKKVCDIWKYAHEYVGLCQNTNMNWRIMVWCQRPFSQWDVKFNLILELQFTY